MFLAFREGNPSVTSGCSLYKASGAEFWFFCCFEPVEQTDKMLVIWDAMVFMWCHGNAIVTQGVFTSFLYEDVIFKNNKHIYLYIPKIGSKNYMTCILHTSFVSLWINPFKHKYFWEEKLEIVDQWSTGIPPPHRRGWQWAMIGLQLNIVQNHKAAILKAT